MLMVLLGRAEAAVAQQTTSTTTQTADTPTAIASSDATTSSETTTTSAATSSSSSSSDPSSSNGASAPGGGGDGGKADFQADLFTGRFSYTVPIKVVPGRQGAQPSLALGYNSSGGNGWCGMGWGLDTGYIQRDVRHGVPIQWSVGSTNPLPQYDDSKGFTASLGGAGSVLVRVGPTNQNPVVYRQQVDTTFLTYNYYTNNHWEVVDKSGNTFYFGEGITNQMENTRTNWTQGVGSSTFRWALDRVIDVNGNETFLKYTTDGNTLYLTNILYNANINSPALAATHEVDFILTNRPDTNITFTSGYRVTQRKLLSEIDVRAGGQNVRKYALNYIQSPSTFRSLLASVTEYGSDYSTTLPALSFNYSAQSFSFQSETNWPIYSQGQTAGVWNGVRSENVVNVADLVDMDGDGLPDRVMSKSAGPYTNYFAIQRNTGSGFVPTNSFERLGALFSQGQTPYYWSSLSASDNGALYTYLVDINGDGFPDRVMRDAGTAYTNLFVELNPGASNNVSTTLVTNTWGPINTTAGGQNWNAVKTTDPGNYATYVDLFDINGDGLPDRVTLKGAAPPYTNLYVRFNTGSNFTSIVNWGPLTNNGAAMTSAWGGTAADENVGGDFGQLLGMYDINGDGLPDRVMRKAGAPYDSFVVQFNNGSGFEPWENWGPLKSPDTNTSNWPYDYGWGSPLMRANGATVWVILMDVNGDGLPDRVMMKPYGSSAYDCFKVQFNTGSGFTTNIYDFGPYASQGLSSYYWWGAIRSSQSDDNDYTDLLDINGDGLIDRVQRAANPPYDHYVVQLGKGPVSDLLTNVNNGLGGSVQIAYKPSTAYDNRSKDWTNDPWVEGAKGLLPFSVNTVSQISAADGMGNISTNTYAFKGGYYNAAEREFRGFSQATVTDPLGTKSTTYFHQSGGRDNSTLGEYLDQSSESKKGIPFRIDVIGNDGTTNKITLNKVEEVLFNSNGCYFPFISQTIAMNYEGLASCRATAKQFSYDTNTENLMEEIDFGEVTNVVVNGQSFTDVGSDSVYTWMTYTNLGRPFDIKITSDSAGANRLRETQMFYDSRGNLTGNQVWLDTSGSFITTISTSYDQYGNPISVTDAAGITTTTIYDSTYEQYPLTQITGTFTNQFSYDVRSGLTLQAIDAKGLVASNSFDVLYRSTASYISTSPYAAPTLWKTKMSYSLGGISSGVSQNYVHKQVNDVVDTVNGFETYTYLDGIGRTIQTRVESETAGQFRVANACYDLRGNAYFQTLPFFDSGSGFTKISGNYMGTLSKFDSVGRSYQAIPAVQGTFGSGKLTSTNATGGDTGSPVGAVTTAFVDGGNPWASVVTDSEGKVKKAYRDAYGRTITITEVTSAGNYNTTYIYDLLGNLTNVTDNANNKTSMAYDSLGRKTAMTDPDMGTWSYVYDNAGRMTQQIDARTNKLTFTYSDQLGRLTSKQIYNSANSLVGTITYTYDTSDDPNYPVFKGQLYKVTDLQGYQRSSYDMRGRVVKTGRFLNVNAMEYVTQTTYDDADRVQTVTYPGNSATIKYAYDTAGNLIQVKSLAGTGTNEIFYTPQSFNALGQLTGYTDGAGVVTTNIYFANSKRLQNVSVKSGTNSLQNLSYTYDTVSDIKSIGDGVYTGGASAAISSVSYDDLYRVTSVNSTARGIKSYGYNSIGNVLTNGDFGSGLYSYSSKPHAVTGANGMSYAYDACGNMTTRGNQTLTYDEQNELMKVSTTNGAVMFGYDDAGERLWRSGTNGYSVWIGGIYEINNGKVLCHVFAGGKRLATFEPQCGGLWAKTVGEKNWYVASTTIQSILNWPFQNGLGQWTMFGGTWAAILGVCMMAGRKVRLKRYEVRRTFRQSVLWKQAVTLVSISAFLWASTPEVQAAPIYGPVFYYYHNDNLGSSNVLTDRTGQMVQHYEYATFGQSSYQNNTSAYQVSNRYTGQICDDETGLYYYGARYYDPQMGRFIQPDTAVSGAGDPQNLNRYTYCGNSPLNHVDPTGHFFIAIIIAIIAVAAFGAATGAIVAAATGGDIGKGALTGAISAVGIYCGGIVGGAIAGIINAEITGGNIGYGALLGAISGAIAFGIGQINTSFGLAPDSAAAYYANGSANAAGGAAGGAIGAGLYGGDPGKGALVGAASGAGGFVFAQSLVTYFRGDTKPLNAEGKSADPSQNHSLGTNGIHGNENDAQQLANQHQGLFLFNKSQGPINDLLTAVWQKLFFGFGDANAQVYHSIAAQMPSGSFFYGHSQGALTVINAGLYGSFPANSTFELNASPASYITARLYLGSSLTFNVHYFDPISVVEPSLNVIKDLSGIAGGVLFPIGIHAHTDY